MNRQLHDILNPSEPYTEEKLKALAEKYPGFSLPSLVALKSTATDRRTQEYAAPRVAVTLPSIDSLRQIAGDRAALLTDFYPSTPQAETPSTLDTISSFLDTYGSADARETDALTKAIFNPVPDYAAVLEAEARSSAPEESDLDPANVGEQDAAINRYIAANLNAPSASTPASDQEPAPSPAEEPAQAPAPEPALTPQAPVQESTPAPAAAPDHHSSTTANSTPSLSESLARVMIKNHNYTKALEIISDLSLKNPEKSVYFADQIRFLRKLIIIENKKQ